MPCPPVPESPRLPGSCLLPRVLMVVCLVFLQACPSPGEQDPDQDSFLSEDLSASRMDGSTTRDAGEGDSLSPQDSEGYQDLDAAEGGPSPLDRFFSLESIHSIEVHLDDAGFASLVAQPKVYVPASVKIDGQVYEEVGIRVKGSLGSFVPIDEQAAGGRAPGKSALIIDFNRYIKGQDHLSLKKLTLNNMVQDPSGMNQYLGYALFREAGIPSSRSGFGVVSINGVEKGLYALVESPDNHEFMESWFGADTGNLYEGAGSDLTLDSYAAFDQDRGEDTSKEDLRQLAEALDAAPQDDGALALLAELIDLDEYLTFAATELYLAHWDGYAWNTNNYIVYHDIEAGSFLFMPWGIDQLFNENSIMGPHHGVMKSIGPSWETPVRRFDSMLHGGRIQQICFSSPLCRARLAQAFREVIVRTWDMELLELARKVRDLIEPRMLEEATVYGDPQATLQRMDQVFTFIENREQELEEWLPCLEGLVLDNDQDTYDACILDCDDSEALVHPGAAEECNIRDDDCNGILDDNPECPECYDLSLFTGTYSICFHPASWHTARTRCLERNQDLVSIHSAQTNWMLMSDLVEKTGFSEAWIGLNDLETEGTYTWTDGSPVNFSYQLIDLPPEWESMLDCVASTAILGWLPQICWDKRAFICK